jgi:methylated-DNA-protein-cysteine methyltransferase-like protein
VIKDSGTRREFETGAVRDIQEGKGRCDLLPLHEVADIMDDAFIECIADFQRYGQVAKLAGNPRWARVVGYALHVNPAFGEIPCHRVVNSAGRTVPGWTEQRELLEAEGVEFKENGNVDMRRFRMD